MVGVGGEGGGGSYCRLKQERDLKGCCGQGDPRRARVDRERQMHSRYQ